MSPSDVAQFRYLLRKDPHLVAREMNGEDVQRLIDVLEAAASLRGATA